jgi:hypothetical protein
MAEYDPVNDGNAEDDLVYLKPTKYILKDAEGGHSHVFYLRDDLPIATTTARYLGIHHEHSIEEGPDGTVICEPAADHTHDTLIVEEEGDYTIRTLFTD